MYTAKVRIAPSRATNLILERWYAADFRTHTLGGQASELFRRLAFTGIQPCGWRIVVLSRCYIRWDLATVPIRQRQVGLWALLRMFGEGPEGSEVGLRLENTAP